MTERLLKRLHERAQRREPARIQRIAGGSIIYIPYDQALYWAVPSITGNPDVIPLNGGAAQKLDRPVPKNIPSEIHRVAYLLTLDDWRRHLP